MAGLGFSVSELAQAVARLNEIRNAFTDENKNSRKEVRRLAKHIQTFCELLAEHTSILETQGEHYQGLESFIETLDECKDFVNEYKGLLDQTQNGPVEWYKIARYTFEKGNITRLQSNITTEMEKLNFFFNNRVMYVCSLTTNHTQSVFIIISPPLNADMYIFHEGETRSQVLFRKLLY
jgi:hypothetical protein